MHNQSFDSPSQPTFPLKSIGLKQTLIPKHVIKWIYRQGTGGRPQHQYTILCHVGVCLIDGTEISSINQSQVVKFIFGRGRLIEGLQLAFSHCQKGEVFKVKISAKYAYEDRQDIKMIPPLSTLIFDINVIDILKPKYQVLTTIELSHQIKHLLEKADDELRKQNPSRSIEILKYAHDISLQLRPKKSQIRQKIVVKMINIKLNQRKIDDALNVLKQYEHIEENYFLLTRCKLKIYQLKGESIQLIEQMKSKYIKYYRNQMVRQQIISYFKKINKVEQIKNIQLSSVQEMNYLDEQIESHSSHNFGMKQFFYM